MTEKGFFLFSEKFDNYRKCSRILSEKLKKKAIIVLFK